jgi:phosphate transport system permease protein
MSLIPPYNSETDRSSALGNHATAGARIQSRLLDRFLEWLITLGGLSVIAAVLLIAFYLVYKVVPMFQPASIDLTTEFSLPQLASGASIYLSSDEHLQSGFRLTRSGEAIFFSLVDGSPGHILQLPLPAGALISTVAVDTDAGGLLALGLDNGSVMLLRRNDEVGYVGQQRTTIPRIEYPYGRDIFELAAEADLEALAVREDPDGVLLVAQTSDALRAALLTKPTAAKSRPVLQTIPLVLPSMPVAKRLLLSRDKRWLALLDKQGGVHAASLQPGQEPRIVAVQPGAGRVQDIGWMLGGQSLIGLGDDGVASQWFMLRDLPPDANTLYLARVRQFTAGSAPLLQFAAEPGRKGFATIDDTGAVSLFNTTAERQLLRQHLTDKALVMMALSPWADALLLETVDGRLALWNIDNHYPEVSWSALWGKVWYEGYSEPEYVWQSSSASTNFEPKLSLVPLVFGTLKAAFYAMLIATPLALGGAIFTAYFMAPAMRTKVKPLIELMEALPTVILGFLAGLWLAPVLESHMIGVFLLLLALPIIILLVALGWHLLPLSVSARIPQGWQAAFMIPVIVVAGWSCFAVSPLVEQSLFGGDFVAWLTQDLGVRFDQRNALVVGIAMGFAIIPTIFSIAEDAIFSVPRHLTLGALALGAKPWQTLAEVILPMASPAIFSALIIGFGRAVGETMIVLMATGNTPIMDVNIFEGMRTLAATIAMEIPEAEVDSSHYRVLFLAGFVLFAMTFVFNTIAELLRYRLRVKYSRI